MQISYSLRYFIIDTVCLVGFNGCVSITPKCPESTSTRGYFCHQGYNFGKNKTDKYKLGVKHGCRTANGYFTKDYKLSGSFQEYVKGWISGRATCKLIVPKDAEQGIMRTEYQQSIDKKSYYGN